ncbi:MAG: hypothetical protein H6835_09740 [Planctomycetes bacterium]|nr:hypothetical protein [Planctomycetota bacterium]
MRTLLLKLSLAALALFASGCKSGDDAVGIPGMQAGKSLYTQVGMHFDFKGGKYVARSTNYLGLPRYAPPGTHLTYQGMHRDTLLLTDDNGSEYQIEFEPKHSLMPLAEWMAQQFGDAAPAIPEDLTDEERRALETGEIAVGMSRAALFLVAGYPPRSNNPTMQENMLRYEVRRIPPLRRDVRFGDDDRIVDISR